MAGAHGARMRAMLIADDVLDREYVDRELLPSQTLEKLRISTRYLGGPRPMIVDQMLERVHRRESTRIRIPPSRKAGRRRPIKQIRELRGNGILVG
jgi:hypothetical protein